VFSSCAACVCPRQLKSKPAHRIDPGAAGDGYAAAAAARRHTAMSALGCRPLAAALLILAGASVRSTDTADGNDGHGAWSVAVDWARPAGVGVSRTLTTLQVVNNPLLDRTFTVNGTTFANPVHAQAWGSLHNLSAAGLRMARFVPWYPYPRKAVAELYRPVEGEPLSWDFSPLLPQLEDFFAATADVQGADTVINFSTEPCWMFDKNFSRCAPPTNPDEADMSYHSLRACHSCGGQSPGLAEIYLRS
jgi:hypothetical protein